MTREEYEDKAFEALALAAKHLIRAENESSIETDHLHRVAVKNVRLTVENCQGMLNELQKVRLWQKNGK
jgi:hypothetical protein